jgi:ADP-ribose pyrophosphatase YjhB (NUDIX family)
MFKEYKYSIELIKEPFDNLKYRDRTILIVVQNSDSEYLLTCSNQYLKGIVRLPGGGVNKDEKLEDAAIRELKEEMNLEINLSELTELASVKITGTYKNYEYKHTVYLYSLYSPQNIYKAGDDVSDIVAYSEKEYMTLVEKFFVLKDTNEINLKNTFSWEDFGKVYGFIHKVAISEFIKNKKK